MNHWLIEFAIFFILFPVVLGYVIFCERRFRLRILSVETPQGTLVKFRRIQLPHGDNGFEATVAGESVGSWYIKENVVYHLVFGHTVPGGEIYDLWKHAILTAVVEREGEETVGRAAEHVRYLLDVSDMWSADGKFVFPDGTAYYRRNLPA